MTMIQNSKTSKGFTLLELLIVLAIIAILAAILIAILNPVEIFRRARDTQRIADLRNLNNAIQRYLIDIAPPDLTNDGAGNESARCLNGTATATVFISTAYTSGDPPANFGLISGTTSRAVDGTGWVPINFTAIAGGSPLKVLPLDPSNSANTANPSLYYGYACDASDQTYELNANLESTKEKAREANNVDGGDTEELYEVGSKLTIITGTSTGYFPNP